MQRSTREWPEAIACIPGCDLLIFRQDFAGRNANLYGMTVGSCNDISNKRASQPQALHPMIYRQSGQVNDRQWIRWQAPLQFLRELHEFNLPHPNCVEAKDC